MKGKALMWFEDFLRDRRQKVVMGDCCSEWSLVTSGVPQGSVLGPLLFVIYINDLPDRVQSLFEMYADDSKAFADVSDSARVHGLQEDLDSVSEWCDKWLMKLNAGKCKVMHLGRNNEKADYNLIDRDTGMRRDLEETDCERDLGVLISSDMSRRKQVLAAVAKANRVLGMLQNTFIVRDSDVWVALYVSLVRPHLDYAVQVWNPYQIGEKKLIEKVQERALNVPFEFRGMSYEEKLAKLKLTTLETRRTRGDLIQVYKLLNGLEQVRDDLVNLDKRDPECAVTRGNSCKLVRENFSSKLSNDFAAQVSLRHNFFSNRVVPVWNALPNSVVSAPSLNSFKARLDHHITCDGLLQSNF